MKNWGLAKVILIGVIHTSLLVLNNLKIKRLKPKATTVIIKIEVWPWVMARIKVAVTALVTDVATEVEMVAAMGEERNK